MGSTGVGGASSNTATVTPQQEFNRTLQESQSDYEKYDTARRYLFNEGRGLGNSTELTPEQQAILNTIDEIAVRLQTPMTLYRTDDQNWLAGVKVGDTIPIDRILYSTIYKDYVIEENRGNVAQQMVINAPVGTRVFNPGQAAEGELDVVRNQSVTVTSIKEENGVPVYTVRVNK